MTTSSPWSKSAIGSITVSYKHLKDLFVQFVEVVDDSATWLVSLLAETQPLSLSSERSSQLTRRLIAFSRKAFFIKYSKKEDASSWLHSSSNALCLWCIWLSLYNIQKLIVFLCNAINTILVSVFLRIDEITRCGWKESCDWSVV